MTMTERIISAEPRHPIRVVAQRTGITPATLRAWERRYGVVEPHRSDGGQRLYSDQDVEHLIRLRLLAEAGRPISLVATLAPSEAEALLQEDRERAPAGGAASETAAEAGGKASARMVEAAFRRAAALDSEGLEASLRRAAVTLGAQPFLEDVVGPLLHRIGAAWASGDLGPAEEHLCTAVTERVLDWLAEPVGGGADGPRMVVGTLPGERHGLGARLVAAAAGLEGWRVTHLGVDLPAKDIAQAARTVRAAAVALSMVNTENLSGATAALTELRSHLPQGTAILVGGAAAGRLGTSSLPANARVVAGLTGLREELGRLG